MSMYEQRKKRRFKDADARAGYNEVAAELFHKRIIDCISSEHVSYKSTKKYLNKLYTEGPQVIQGPGENAGIMHIGNGWCIALRIESHNHPSFINPYEGAATGVGGILRDIFTMGARPIALLDFLRFNNDEIGLELLKEVVRGISDYGNTVGVPIVGGDLIFDETYKENCLVNVCCIGLVEKKNIIYGRALTPGNDIIYVGARTGRDGIGGAEMASKSLVELDQSAIQSSDPFLEKLLIEACCELAETDWIEGMQDMGAAGILCSTSEVLYRGRKLSNEDLGVDLWMERIPLKSDDMDLGDIMMSESQERMLIVGKVEHRDKILELFRKWDLEAVIIGKVDTSGLYKVNNGDFLHCFTFDELFPDLNEDWPLDYYERKITKPTGPTRAQLKDVWNQYDWMVGARTQKGPNEKGQFAVLDIPEADKELVITWGSSSQVEWAFYTCTETMAAQGAKPIGLTNCLNFGHPKDTMGEFARVVEKLDELCRSYDIPVVSGNVSLYNSTEDYSIKPTPVLVMLGIRDRGK